MLFDSHCHLDVAEFDADRDAALARARAAGVCDQLVPAVDRAHWEGLHALCARETGLHPAYGVHPMFLDAHSEADVEQLPSWIAQHRCVAIGECGLDYFVEGLDRELQLDISTAAALLRRHGWTVRAPRSGQLRTRA